MFYVYVIRSLSDPKRYYIGFTENIDQRVKEHNEGKSLHTVKYGLWELAFYLAVPSKTKALDLERYLKSGSGRHFCTGIFFEEQTEHASDLDIRLGCCASRSSGASRAKFNRFNRECGR